MRARVLMQRKDVTWIVVLLALVGLSILVNRNRFAKEQMIINPSLRPARRADATVWPVFFALNDDFRLTSVKVIPFDGDKFDPLAHPVWQLVSDSNSVPTRAFRYGQPIKGMKPAVPNLQPDALEPGVVYRLLVEAGSVKATTDFSTKETTP
jgi:hypothetical protein